MSELEIEGECDKCDATYDIGSRDNRCGDCGNCGNCCTHKGERVMSEITIKGITKEDTGWTKEITLEREGETYLATLYWSSSDGYDLVFKNNPTPKWVEEWEDRQQYGEESLEYTLDSLTEDVIEGSYL